MPMPIEDQRQAIRARAYAIWEQEGRLHGSDWAHWFQAEAEVKSSLLRDIRDATFLANRAFVFLQKIEWQFIGDKSTHTITKWRFIPIWQNNGNTPTKYMVNRVNFAACEKAIDLGFDFPELGNPQVGHTTIGPRAIMHAAHIDVSAEVLEKVNNREAYAYIWGWADYNDILPGTSRHRTEFCFEIVVNGDLRAENCQFFFRQHPQYNGIDNECLREPRPGGAVAYYKFIDAADVDKVLVNGTLIVSSFEYFRKLEAAQWGAIADPLEAASELTVRGSFVIRENSPELEIANKANIGLGMFQKFAEVSEGGIIDISGTRFIHAAPNLFVFSASVGEINELTKEMCVKAERPYNACLRILDIGALRKRIFDAGRIPELNCKVSEVFEPGLIGLVEYEARSQDIREGETIVPSPFKKDIKFKHQSEVRMLLVPKEPVNISKERLIIEIPGLASMFEKVFVDYEAG
jgi:hypothetical protein